MLAASSYCILFSVLSETLWSFWVVQELDHVVEELEKIAVVNLLQHRSIISLIGNVQRSSLILEKVRPAIPLSGEPLHFIIECNLPIINWALP